MEEKAVVQEILFASAECPTVWDSIIYSYESVETLLAQDIAKIAPGLQYT